MKSFTYLTIVGLLLAALGTQGFRAGVEILAFLEEDVRTQQVNQWFDRQLEGQQRVTVAVEKALADLSRGHLRFDEALERLHDQIRDCHPSFFINLHRAEQGRTMRERVARSFLRHLAQLGWGGGDQPDSVLLEKLVQDYYDTFGTDLPLEPWQFPEPSWATFKADKAT